jgi:hypothetical protein
VASPVRPASLARIVRSAIALTLIAAVAIGATAAAQESAPGLGNYGGGAVVASNRSLYGAGNMLIGLRSAGDGTVQINATVTLACSEDAVLSLRTTLAADGSFVERGTSSRRGGPGVDVVTTYRLSGRILGPAAGGKATVRNAIVHDGAATTRCPRVTVRWSARRPAGEIGGAPAPGSRLHGTTSQRLHGPRRAITLRLSSDGATLARALYDITVRCDSKRVTAAYDAPRRNLAIAPGGVVHDVERFTIASRRTIYRSVERFAGTIGSSGGAGTFSTSVRIADRRSGRTLDRCRSGRVTWTAAR